MVSIEDTDEITLLIDSKKSVPKGILIGEYITLPGG